MQIVSLKLLNFRNYDYLNLSFSLNNNLIYGKNGSGKTNLVESIYVLALTKSFRGSLDKVLIMDGKNLASISGVIQDNVVHDYQIVVSNDGKMVKIDKKAKSKLSEYVSKINVIMFSPDYLRFIKESPKVRRDRINLDITQLDNDYLKTLNLYNKILKQRNAYLKTMYLNANNSTDYLNILTDKLINYGIILTGKRKKFFTKLNVVIKEIYKDITGINDVSIMYLSNYSDNDYEKLKKLYKNYYKKDILNGKTTFGPHHDDYIFMWKDKPFKDFASEGQQKNAIIAYKLAEIKIFKEIKNSCPILILDDLFSELDREKINNILNLLNCDDIQTFITTTEIDSISADIKNKSKIFYCDNGKIREEVQ